MNTQNTILSTQEAADFLGAHVETVRRLARKGDIPAYKMGKDWRFRREALLRWIGKHHLTRRPPTVLVVDDDASARRLMQRFLEAADLRVCLAADGAEALDQMSRQPVDLILLDLAMPGMNGPAFLQETRRDYAELPVIVTTGHPDSDLMREALRFGPITLLAKPVNRKQLIGLTETLLNGTRALKSE